MYKDFYCYPAVFNNGNNEIGVYFPDFDGCISGGVNLESAIKNAKEALSLHIFGMEEDGETLPEPATPRNILLVEGDYLIMIDINYKLFKEKMLKKSVDRMVTLPRYLNAAAKDKGINISQLLQEALKKQLGL